MKMELMSPTDLSPTTLREAFGHFPSGVIAIADASMKPPAMNTVVTRARACGANL